MSVEDNKALVRRSIEGENRADMGMLEDCYAMDYVHPCEGLRRSNRSAPTNAPVAH